MQSNFIEITFRHRCYSCKLVAYFQNTSLESCFCWFSDSNKEKTNNWQKRLKKDWKGLLGWNHGYADWESPSIWQNWGSKIKRNTKYFWEKPRKLWRVIGAYRCQYYRKRYKHASFHSSKCWIICHDKIFCYRLHLFWLTVSIQDPCKHIVKVDPRSLWCYLYKIKGKLICLTIEIPRFIFS